MNGLLHIAWAVYQWTCTLMFMLFSKSFPQPTEGCNITCCKFRNLFLQFSYLETVDCNLKSNDAILKWQSCESCGVLYVHLGGHEPKIIIATMYYTVVHNVLRNKARTYSSWIWSESLWMNWDAVLRKRLVWLPHQHNY